jgi:hypothetical protein
MARGADLGGILGEGNVPDPVQLVLDRPVPTEVAGELPGCGLAGGQAGHSVDGDGAPSSAGKVADAAGDLDGLGGVREAQASHGGDLQGADLDPTVALVAGPIQQGFVAPWQRFELGRAGPTSPCTDPARLELTVRYQLVTKSCRSWLLR